MNDLLTVTDELLDEMISHEAGCESAHLRSDNKVCSGMVTHRYMACCGDDRLFCTTATQSVAKIISANATDCDGCSETVADCWSVIPV